MPQLALKHPRLHVGDAEETRKATWLELFYDLIYVATVTQLGTRLSQEVSLVGILAFAALFVPIWWSWVGTTFYANRFDSDDAVHRGLVFLKILGVSLMAVSVHDALGETAPQFAIGYALVRFVLVVMYLRARTHIKAARALATRHAIGFGLAGAAWLVSAILPSPARFIMWGLGLLVDFATPLSPRSAPAQDELPTSPRHLPERFGLFTIIVLGEASARVISGLAGRSLALDSLLVDAPGLLIAGSLWWIYFDNVAETQLKWEGIRAQIWLYMHLPLQLGLAAFGVGIYKLVTLEADTVVPDSYRWLIGGSVALSLFALAVIEWTTIERKDVAVRWKSQIYLRLGSALLVLLLAMVSSAISTTVLIVLIAAIAILQVAVDLYWRLKLEPKAELPQL